MQLKESSHVLRDALDARHVVGDLHGQFWDLLHLLEMCGDPWHAAEWLPVAHPRFPFRSFGESLASKDPSPRNQYLFNGDFVTWKPFFFNVCGLRNGDRLNG